VVVGFKNSVLTDLDPYLSVVKPVFGNSQVVNFEFFE
jgi:hypothetical protein